MNYIENKVQKMGIETIRLDAFTLNRYVLKMYENLGYIKIGMHIGEKVNSILWKRKFKYENFTIVKAVLEYITL